MKTRRFATAFERGRVSARRAQAWGFVSRIMVNSDGGGSVGQQSQLPSEQQGHPLAGHGC